MKHASRIWNIRNKSRPHLAIHSMIKCPLNLNLSCRRSLVSVTIPLSLPVTRIIIVIPTSLFILLNLFRSPASPRNMKLSYMRRKCCLAYNIRAHSHKLLVPALEARFGTSGPKLSSCHVIVWLIRAIDVATFWPLSRRFRGSSRCSRGRIRRRQR